MKKKKTQPDFHRRGKRWTQKEEDLLKKLYPDVFTHELEEYFGRTVSALGTKAAEMGIRKSWIKYGPSRFHDNKSWSQKEIKRLQKLFPKLSTSQLLTRFPKRSANAIKGKAAVLGLYKNYRNHSEESNADNAKLSAKLRLWSAEKIEKLRTLWEQGYTKSEIAQIIGKSRSSVSAQLFIQMRDFGLDKKYEHRTWSKKEVAYLTKHYKNTSARQLSTVLGRKMYTIHHKARLLNLTSDAVKLWTKEEISTLRKYYKQWPIEKMAKKLGRSAGSIKGKAEHLNIMDTYKPWTTTEINMLKKYCNQWTNAKIAKRLGRSISAVQRKIQKLRLRRK